jgi:hypothetical protein
LVHASASQHATLYAIAYPSGEGFWLVSFLGTMRGAISLGDLLIISAWAAINAAWMYAMLDRNGPGFKLL